MLGIFLLSLIVATLASPGIPITPRIDAVDNTIYEDFLLSNNTVPSRYRVTLTLPSEALSGGLTNFSGSVIITFRVTEPTNVIRLHSLVNIINISLAPTAVATTPITITSHTVNATTETVEILLATTVTANVDYNLGIQYSGNLDLINMQGFYRSEYVVNGVTEYMATTQFQPTHARKAFPCFDEPQYKASFIVMLTYPVGFVTASNTPIVSTTSSIDLTTETVTFTETPIMSTYLLAFTVSKFTCTSLASGSTPFGVCSRPALAADRSVALNYGIEIMGALDSWTNYFYNSTSIGKMDQYAIPDFSAGAMENWGLVTYREYLLLWNELDTSNLYRQRLIAVIAHEFAHMWFGNLVTTKWWDTTFLNEGFARYYQYFIVNQLTGLATYEMDKQFIIEQQQSAFLEDASLTSASLTSGAWTPAQIRAKFGLITYNKGASIIRMIENTIGTINFQAALQQYLVTNAYQAATPDLLWAALGSLVPAGTLPGTLTFPQFIDSWANKAGFPVVTVTANGSDFVLSQKRFLYSGTEDTQWNVPVTYVLPGGRAYATTWLQPNASTTISNIADNSWIIVNHDSRGYYRVHYDNTLRERIISTLQADHNQISDLSRAQIIDDALNLARARQINYSEAFKVLNYLKNETSYYPWYAAIRGLNYLTVRLGNSSVLGQRINGMLLDLIDNVSANISTTNLLTTDHITTLKLQTVWTAACRSGQERCILDARNLFLEFRINNTNINPNLRDIVYCNALRHSTDINADWNFLWNRLQTIDQPHEVLYILLSLGCTTDRSHLTYLLDQSLNTSSVIRIQDLATVWSSVYATSVEGAELAFDYFIANYAAILEYYPSATSILPNIVARFTTNAQVAKLQGFINQQAANSTIRSVAESALTTAQANLQWQLSIQGDLNQHFGIGTETTSSATIFRASLYLLFLIVFFI